MSDIIRLGGNIELLGASAIDPATMIVLKKIVGHAARAFSEQTSMQKLSLSFNKNDSGVTLQGALTTEETTHTSEASHHNLFLALDVVLKSLERDLK